MKPNGGGGDSGKSSMSDDQLLLLKKLNKAERRKRRRATPKYRNLHASRERHYSIRVESFNNAFAMLRSLLPTLPRDKKLSKIEILRLSIAYMAYLDNLLSL